MMSGRTRKEKKAKNRTPENFSDTKERKFYGAKILDALSLYNMANAEAMGLKEGDYRLEAEAEFGRGNIKTAKHFLMPVLTVLPKRRAYPRMVPASEQQTGDDIATMELPPRDGTSRMLRFAYTMVNLYHMIGGEHRDQLVGLRLPGECFMELDQLLGIEAAAEKVAISGLPGVLFNCVNGKILRKMNNDGNTALLIERGDEKFTHVVAHFEFFGGVVQAEYRQCVDALNENRYSRILEETARPNGTVDLFALVKLGAIEAGELERRWDQEDFLGSERLNHLMVPMAEVSEPETLVELEVVAEVEPESELEIESEPVEESEPEPEVVEGSIEEERGLEMEPASVVEAEVEVGKLEPETEIIETMEVEPEAEEVAMEIEVEAEVEETEPEPESAPESETASKPRRRRGRKPKPKGEGFTTSVTLDGPTMYRQRRKWVERGDANFLAWDYIGPEDLAPGFSFLLEEKRLLSELKQGDFRTIEERFRSMSAKLFGLEKLAKTVEVLPGYAGENSGVRSPVKFSFTMLPYFGRHVNQVLVRLETTADPAELALENTIKVLGEDPNDPDAPWMIRADYAHRPDILFERWSPAQRGKPRQVFLLLNLVLSERYQLISGEALEFFKPKAKQL